MIGYLRSLERAIVAALAREGLSTAGAGDRPTGVWVSGREDRVDRRPRLAARDHARLRRQRRQRPCAVLVDRPVRPPDVQMTSVARETGRAHTIGGLRRTIASSSPAHSSARPASGRAGATAGRAGRLIADGCDDDHARGRTPAEWTSAGSSARTRCHRARASRRGSRCPAPGGPRYRELTALIADAKLHTVCQEAACPNVGECWERGTATFMILGDTCTRRCGFCNVKTGRPTWNDPLEPARVARSVARMGLRHAVITSVDRDDLPDLGSGAFATVIREVRRQAPACQIEVLTPDFQGQEMPLARVIAGASRRLQPQRRGRSEAVPARAPRLGLPALGAGAAQREGAGWRGGHDEVGADGRARRDPRGDGRVLRPAARARRAGADGRPVPAAQPRAAPAGRPLVASRRVRGASRAPPTRWASSTSLPARSCAPPTTPTSTCRRRARVGPLAAAALIPLRDSIRLARLPIVTILLIGANVVAYLVAVATAGRSLDGPTTSTIVRWGAIPYEFTHLSSPLRARGGRLLET